MRLAKLRLPPGGPNAVLQTVKNYNHSVSENPTVIRDENDPMHIDWLGEFDRGYINVDEVCLQRESQRQSGILLIMHAHEGNARPS